MGIPYAIHAQFGSNWPSGFRGEDVCISILQSETMLVAVMLIRRK